MATVVQVAEALLAEDEDDGGRAELEPVVDFLKRLRLNVEGAVWKAYAAAPLERDGCVGVCLRKVA